MANVSLTDSDHLIPCSGSTAPPRWTITRKLPLLVRPVADRAVLDGAVAMAWTAIDAALDATVRARLLGPAASR